MLQFLATVALTAMFVNAVWARAGAAMPRTTPPRIRATRAVRIMSVPPSMYLKIAAARRGLRCCTRPLLGQHRCQQPARRDERTVSGHNLSERRRNPAYFRD